MRHPLLEVQDLRVSFSLKKQTLYAVRGISFTLHEGESLGIVGESGSGKSAAMQAITRLSKASISGKVLFQNQPIMRPMKEIGMVFQDPMSALNPTMKIGDQIAEGLIYHKLLSKPEAKMKALELLTLVGVSEPEIRIHQYPHQFSGGMRQRVVIAIAIACNPKLLIADEPTTALDVTIQAQILELIQSLQKKWNMGLIFISHDFHVVQKVCDQILVMYAGKIVESGATEEVLRSPKHPYTQMLIRSSPRIDQPKEEPLSPIEGTPPNLWEELKGCAFRERCPYAALKCLEEPKGPVACWRKL